MVTPPEGAHDASAVLVTSLPRNAGGLPRSRRLAGLALALVGLPVLTAVLVELRDALARESVLLTYLLAVVVIAVVGGVLPALVGAVGSFLLANWFLTPPYNTLAVHDRRAFVDLLVFVVAGGVVSLTVDLGARQRAKSERNLVEARLISRLSAAGDQGGSVEQILEQVRVLYAMRTVGLHRSGSARGEFVASVGPAAHGDPTLSVPAGQDLALIAYGPEQFGEDRRLLDDLAAAAGRAWERKRVADKAARAEQLAETDRVRSALLAAVSHDLRTPIAGIKAAASGLRQQDVDWEPDEERELLATIEDSVDRLGNLVDNLLAMSRIQAGALSVHLRPTALDEVVARALLSVGDRSEVVDVPDDLPYVTADDGLLERVVANLVDNALRFSPDGSQVRVFAVVSASAPEVALAVRDTGPGVDPARWEEMFVPFQRLGDRSQGGIGLGLAIARGLTTAMGGRLEPGETPGGGLTMTITLPVAS